MSNFGTMYVFELRKIFKRKIVGITLCVMLVVCIFMGIAETLNTSVYTDGENTVEVSGYEALQKEKENAVSISGLAIDQALLNEVGEAYKCVYYYSKYLDESISTSSMAADITEEESQQELQERKMARERFQRIYWYLYQITGDYNAVHVLDEESLYQARMDYIQSEWEGQKLTPEEEAYWQEKEKNIKKPFVYGYADGWDNFFDELYTMNVLLVLATAVCLSGVFSDEHVRKTDQLILCSRLGKKTLYGAKILAGITFGVSCAALMYVASLISTLLVYGADGFDVALQLCAPMESWNITVGQAVLLMSLIYFVVAVLYSVIAMFLSEALRSSVAVMGLMTGGMFFTLMFGVSVKYRILSQIYELLPTLIMGMWKFTDYRLVKIFGIYFTNMQIAPILYILFSVILILLGKRIYRNYQVSGR